MRLHPVLLAGALGLILSAGICRADEQDKPAPSPLRLIPAESDFLLQVRDPARLADLGRNLELVSKLLELPIVQDQLDSTNLRRARQLLAHFEKNLGDKWPELLAKVAGGGIALAGTFGNNAPALLVLQGKDEQMMKQAVELAVGLLEAELTRQESKDKVVKRSENGIDTYAVGQGLFAARIESALVVSNNKQALSRAINLYRGKDKKSLATHPAVAEANKLLPEKPLIDAWLNMAPVHKSPGAKDLYKSPRDNFILTLTFGGYLDVVGRAPFLCAALAKDKDGFLFTLRAPRGRDGMGVDRLLHLPPADHPGCRPLLESKNVLYSTSFHFDFANIWLERDKLFPKAQSEGLAQADKNSGRFLLGTKISHLFESAGARHRFVIANQTKTGYKRTSRVTLPAFAFVPELRNPGRFGRTVDLALRAGALALTGQFNLELNEEKYKGVDIVAYRFDEKAEVPDDVNDLRFAFSPCWARVGQQFIFCTTIELCRDLIDALQAEEKAQPKSLAYTAIDRYYSPGFAQLLTGLEDQLITQAILGQAIEPAEAKKQVRQFIDLVKGVGDTTSHSDFRDKEWRYEFRFGK